MRPTAASTSESGGTVLAIRTELYRKASRRLTTVRMRGRAIAISLLVGQWLHFCVVHVDSAQTMLRRQDMLQTIHDHHRALSGVSFLLGAWNFIHTDKTRLLSSGSDVRSDAHLAKFFEDTFSGFVEMRQLEHTFRRLAHDAGAFSTFSRIDRIYTSAHPSALMQHSVQAWVKGDLTTRTSASDHRAVEVDIRIRRRQTPHTSEELCRFPLHTSDYIC